MARAARPTWLSSTLQNRKMKPLDLLNCARPVLFENDDEVYKYSSGGTAFTVRFRDRLYVITAKHVLTSFSKQKKDFSCWKQFRVQYYPDTADFIPITALYVIEHEDTDDTDKFDLAVFKVEDINANEKLFRDHKPYELSEGEGATAFDYNSKFIYRGFFQVNNALFVMSKDKFIILHPVVKANIWGKLNGRILTN
jgi:hypothetical protein